MTSPTTRAVCAERTMTLPRPHPLNPLRRLLRRPVPTYTAHLFADAVVYAADEPALSLELVDGRHVQVRFTWPGTTGGITSRLSVRERGADRFLSGVREQHDFPALDDADSDEDGDEGVDGFRNLSEFMRAARPPAGSLRYGIPADFRERLLEDPTPAQVYACHGFTPLPGEPAPPTESTCVLHDLAFVMDQLETAQAQVAMTAGGAGEGSMDNAAHVALCAAGVIRAKLAVVATYAGEANLALVEATTQGAGEGRQDFINRARRMVLCIAGYLPERKESPHVAA